MPSGKTGVSCSMDFQQEELKATGTIWKRETELMANSEVDISNPQPKSTMDF
jgi:hypothetical protein